MEKGQPKPSYNINVDDVDDDDDDVDDVNGFFLSCFSVQPFLLAPTGALVVALLPLFHITSSRSSKSLYNLLTLLKNLEHLCLYT